MNSLRWRLVVGIVSGLTLLLGAGGAMAYLAIRERLYSEFDRSLVQRAVLLASMIEPDAGNIKIEWLEGNSSPPGYQPGIDYFCVWTKDRAAPIAVSADLEKANLPRFGGSFANPEVREVLLPGNQPARCAGIEFDVRRGLRDEEEEEEPDAGAVSTDPAAPPGATIVQLVIAKVDTVGPTLEAIRRPLIGLWAGCTLLGGAIIWMVVRRSLRPLDLLKIQIRSLEEGSSGQRIALPREPAELEPVTQELNRLLERVEKVLLRERMLTSNVAHELRTPIAGLLTTLEVTLNRLRSPEDYRESSEECFEIAKRMNWLVNNLLSLTRLEAGNVRLQCQDIRIAHVLPEWWKPFETRAANRGLRVDWQIDPDASIETDPEFFRVVVTNLFDNAVSYTQEGGTIRVEANSHSAISVANQADGLNAALIDHAFDPFWRNPELPEGAATHAGLGLSLCRRILELLGGRISAQIRERESLFVVRLEMI